ncbi:12772_t:CDS:2, partial [Gigaspora rosea]
SPFTNYMKVSLTNNMWNIFINYSRDTFSNYMDNTYVIQMNDSEILTADKSTGVDKGTGADMSIDKGIEVNNGMSVNKNVNKDAGVNEENTEFMKINRTESDMKKSKANSWEYMDGSSFITFLQEIEDVYENSSSQLRDPLACIRSGASIRGQSESVKRRKNTNKENDPQKISKRKAQKIVKNNQDFK